MTVTLNGRETTDIVTARGTITVPAQEATSLQIRFDNADVVKTVDPTTGVPTALPVGVNEVRILGAEDIVKGPGLDDVKIVPCGFGPDLVVDGSVRAETSVMATVRGVLTDSLITATPCGGRVLALDAGPHVVDVASTDEYVVEVVALEPVDAAIAAPVEAPAVQEWGSTHRIVDVPVSDVPRILETTENANSGWRATLDGEQLSAVRVDGWRQGWIVPAGAGGLVVLDFGAQSAYLGGLLTGLVAALILVALAVVGRGRSSMPLPEPPVSSGRWLAGSALVVGLVIGGWPGLVVAAGAVALAWAASRWLAAGALGLLAAAGAAIMPWPGRLDAPTWLLVATALLAIAALAAAGAPARTPRVSADGPSPGPASPG